MCLEGISERFEGMDSPFIQHRKNEGNQREGGRSLSTCAGLHVEDDDVSILLTIHVINFMYTDFRGKQHVTTFIFYYRSYLCSSIKLISNMIIK